MKENRKIQEVENHNMEVEQVRENRIKQIELEMYRSLERKKEN